MIYGIIKVELDDFSALDTRWVPDVESIMLFRDKAYRDRVLRRLQDGCESFEDFVPFDRDIMEHTKDERGRFSKRNI